MWWWTCKSGHARQAPYELSYIPILSLESCLFFLPSLLPFGGSASPLASLRTGLCTATGSCEHSPLPAGLVLGLLGKGSEKTLQSIAGKRASLHRCLGNTFPISSSISIQRGSTSPHSSGWSPVGLLWPQVPNWLRFLFLLLWCTPWQKERTGERAYFSSQFQVGKLEELSRDICTQEQRSKNVCLCSVCFPYSYTVWDTLPREWCHSQ